MKITEIKQQVKRHDRYSVYIDGAYSCSFSPDEILSQGLRVGLELSSEDLRVLKANAIKDKAYDRCLNLLARRPRSEWELRDYLKRKEYEPEVVDGTVERLRNRGYVNDADFAARWVSSRRALKPVSKRRLQQELQQKRVSLTAIAAALENEETNEKDALRQLVERKRARYPDSLKFMQYLSRQGFSYDDIKSVLNEDVIED